MTRPGGHVPVSSYSERFWDSRLEWFEAQAAEGLIGAIDYATTHCGVIVYVDGFRATTITPVQFEELARAIGIERVL